MEKGKSVVEVFDNTLNRLSKIYFENKSTKNFRAIPSEKMVKQIIKLVKLLIFPEFFYLSNSNETNIKFFLSDTLKLLYKKLNFQIYNSLYFENPSKDCKKESKLLTIKFIKKIPEISNLINKDIQAIYNGDPAAKSISEIILCYPAVKAILCYRIAHELYISKISLLPRMISEIAHSETGIDIHPATQIGEYFCIDHGTGVVIGETCIIGKNVKIYQNVTLGAKKFKTDIDGKIIKGIPRHPIIKDNVTIYSNATVLGRITINEN